MKELTIRRLKNTDFSSLYQKLLKTEVLNGFEQIKILQLAVVFINSNNDLIRKLGYRIVVLFSVQYECYAPLYEIALNLGLYPISAYIEQHLSSELEKGVFAELNSAYTEIYRQNDIYNSEEQYLLSSFYESNSDRTVSVVAPTSYGKTDLILNTLRATPQKNVCIITPTKSLLAQTRKRILAAQIPHITKVVTHPDMVGDAELSCVAVLTQERLMRLLKNRPKLYFDYVIVDEAHDMLLPGNRSELLAAAIMVLNKRNSNTSFKFLTPFLNDSSNLRVRYSAYQISEFRIKEYIKTEKVYAYDIKSGKGLAIYDQFLDEWYDVPHESKAQSDIDFLVRHGGRKNIVYFNKPTDIEKFASRLIETLPDIATTPELEAAIENISQYIDPEYTLVKCLRKGFAYHHGSVPDTIRQYIEYQYDKCPEIKYMLTTSTLLEGVNLPADKMFIFDNRKGGGYLSPSNFKNLIGRVCRFNEIFNAQTGSLQKLIPEIYLVVGDYFRKDSDYRSFVSKSLKMDRELSDTCENVLVESTPVTKEKLPRLQAAQEFIENYEPGIVTSYDKRYVSTETGKSCILNSVNEFDVFAHESTLDTYVDALKNQGYRVSTCEELIDLLNRLFIPNIDVDRHDSFLRFRNDSARRYYAIFLKQKIDNNTYAEMVARTMRYWRHLISTDKDTIVYVGKWGDTTRGNGFREYWTDISRKSRTEQINLAIVRIKEEQDFIDNTIMKFVEVLNDVDLMEKTFYLKLKYGTDSVLQIAMIKNGISLSLSTLLLEKYRQYVSVDIETDVISLSPDVIDAMKTNSENEILIYEAQNNTFDV